MVNKSRVPLILSVEYCNVYSENIDANSFRHFVIREMSQRRCYTSGYALAYLFSNHLYSIIVYGTELYKSSSLTSSLVSLKYSLCLRRIQKYFCYAANTTVVSVKLQIAPKPQDGCIRVPDVTGAFPITSGYGF